MATTRLMPLHIGKGQTAGDAIKRVLGYIKDPMKTENGILVTSYGCTPQTAEAEFMLMRPGVSDHHRAKARQERCACLSFKTVLQAG